MRKAKMLLPATGAAAIAVAIFTWPSAMATAGTKAFTATPNSSTTKVIEPFRPKFGRSRPLVAVVGENSATELTDFVVPYSVLSRSGDADVLTVATRPGVLKMRPALQIQPHTTMKQFDADHPDGADYVIVPAIVNSTDPVLLSWIRAQAAKGATIVSICDGALVVANTGLFNGHRATAHWATEGLRKKKYPEVRWQQNVRYVADGKLISSAGISASVPVSLALVEAISGRAKATAVAKSIGARDWGTAHNSDQFRLSRPRNMLALFRTTYLNPWLHSRQAAALPLSDNADEMALAFLADGYTRTGRAQAIGVNAGMTPVVSRHGLTFVPERALPRRGGDLNLSPSVPPGASHLEEALRGIQGRYGSGTAYAVALQFEYPTRIKLSDR